jgi:hypothetical protein
MLRFELERAQKFASQHLGGARDERVNEYLLSVEVRTCETPLLKIDVDSI